MQLLNENHLSEMCKIMENLQEYVPSVSREEILEVANQTVTLEEVTCLPVLLGGDQLTTARARGAQAIRSSHDNARDRLEKLVPVIEDWHARLTLAKVFINHYLMHILSFLTFVVLYLKAIWNQLYSDKSGRDKATLFNLKHILNRTC